MRVFGHPLHPMLVHFPIAFWTLATVCDALALAGLAQTWRFGWLALAIGTTAALPTAIAGLLDFARLEARAMKTGTLHMALMGCAFLVYTAALGLRTRAWAPLPVPGLSAILCSVAGFLLLAIGGHFGAALVYRYSAGREETR